MCVKLKAELPVRGDRLTYSLDVTTGEHQIIAASTCAIVTGSAGAIANVLAPYRSYREVNELFNWLVK